MNNDFTGNELHKARRHDLMKEAEGGWRLKAAGADKPGRPIGMLALKAIGVLIATLFIVLILVAGVRAGTGNAADLSDCVQRQSGSASAADTAALDWVGRHTASLTAAPDWVERHAASLTAGNAMALSDCIQRQPGFASPADTAAADWVERHAASLKAGSAASLSSY